MGKGKGDRARKLFVLAVLSMLLSSTFLALIGTERVYGTYSDEETGLDLVSVDGNFGKSLEVGDYTIFLTDLEVLFFEDDLTSKTFTLAISYTPTDHHSYEVRSSMIQYSASQILVAVSYVHKPDIYHYHHDLEYWIINVNTLAYSHNLVDLDVVYVYYMITDPADFALVELDGVFYAVVGGQLYSDFDSPCFHVVTMYEGSASKVTVSSVDAMLYGSSIVVPHYSDSSRAYIVSRISLAGTAYRVFRFDADDKTLTLVGTGSNNHYSDFVYCGGYLAHTIYGTEYYDVLVGYHHPSTSKTVLVSLIRFSDSSLDEEYVTITPSSTISTLRVFSMLTPDGVTGEGDLNNGYYGVVYAGVDYALMYTTLLLTGIETLTPSLSYSTEDSYQSKTHYYDYSGSLDIGGWHPTTSVVGLYIDFEEGDAIAETFDANPLAYQTYSYKVTVSSDPEINADFYIGMDTYETPDEVEDLYGYYWFTAQASVVYGDTGYVFDYWLVDGEDEYEEAQIELLITENTTIEIFYEEAPIYQIDVVSDPAIGSTYYVAEDAETYTTPETHYWVEGNYTFTAQNSKIVEDSGYVFANYTVTPLGEESLLDSYGTEQQDNLGNLFTVFDDDYSAYFQSFNATESWAVTKVAFYLNKTGTPTGTLKAAIYAHAGTFGTSSIPTGSPLATSGGLDISTLTGDLTLYNFTFSGGVSLSPATCYVIVVYVESGSLDESNYINVGVDVSSPTHDGNFGGINGDVWSYVPVVDLIFYLYGGLEESNVYYDRTTEFEIDTSMTITIMYEEVEVYHITVSAEPEIAATFTVDDEDSCTTPDEIAVTEGEHDLSITESKTYGGDPYVFAYWIVDGENTTDNPYEEYEITENITITAYYDQKEYSFSFMGVYNETTGLITEANCTVTVYFDQEDTPNYEFTFNTSYNYLPDIPVRYFHFELGTNDREYWVEPDETISTIYVFNDTLTGYTINFLDFCGALEENAYVTAQFYINGTLMTMDKRKVDEENNIAMSLVDTRKYVITLSGSGTTYTWGDLLMTSQTTVQLILKAIDFPKDQILKYHYLRIYAYRTYNTTDETDTITIHYEDTKEETTSVQISIDYTNGTNAYNTTQTADTFTVNWANANENSTYIVTATVDHETYGVTEWIQTLTHGYTPPPPFGLDWLGDWDTWGIESSVFLPSLLIIAAAGCFSVINAQIGAVLAAITAIILTTIGWITIASGTLVVAFALAILMALVYSKRRVTTY